MSLQMTEWYPPPRVETKFKCIILLLGSDNKVRAVMEDTAHPLPAIRIFADVDDAVAYAADQDYFDATFQIVELEDIAI